MFCIQDYLDWEANPYHNIVNPTEGALWIKANLASHTSFDNSTKVKHSDPATLGFDPRMQDYHSNIFETSQQLSDLLNLSKKRDLHLISRMRASPVPTLHHLFSSEDVLRRKSTAVFCLQTIINPSVIHTDSGWSALQALQLAFELSG